MGFFVFFTILYFCIIIYLLKRYTYHIWYHHSINYIINVHLSAQKIHLSEATHLALQKLGGYTTAFRDELQIKVGVRRVTVGDYCQIRLV